MENKPLQKSNVNTLSNNVKDVFKWILTSASAGVHSSEFC